MAEMIGQVDEEKVGVAQQQSQCDDMPRFSRGLDDRQVLAGIEGGLGHER